MKITIIKNRLLLKNYLSLQKKPCSILGFETILDNDEFTPHSVIHLNSFPSQKILDEYIEIISEIGHRNKYSVPWLCHPISEKNDLLPDNLFDRIIDFMRFHTAFTDCKDDEIILITRGKALIKNISDFSKNRNITCTIIEPSHPEKKTFLSGLQQHISFLLKKLNYSRSSRFLLNNINKQKDYTIIRTWFDLRSIPLINNDSDIYFGELPGWLKNKGKIPIYFGGIVSANHDETLNSISQNNLNNPVLLDCALLNWLDYLNAFFFRLSLKFLISLPARVTILNAEVTNVFNNYFRDHLNDHFISKNYLSYLSVKKLFKTLKIELFYNLYENYSWEKLTTRAVRENKKSIKLIAFQHAQISQNSTKFFLGKTESLHVPLPDKIITLGETTRNFLVNEKNYPAYITVAGCALRHNYQKTKGRIQRKNTKRILVPLWTFESSLKILKFLSKNKTLSDKYKTIIIPHPTEPFTKLKPHLKSNYENKLTISDKTLTENLLQADMVIYYGTTACLDALSAGLPIINLELSSFISPDPLFSFTEFKWTAQSTDELLEKIELIYYLDDNEYYTRQAGGLKFVKKYCQPVTDEKLQVFLT